MKEVIFHFFPSARFLGLSLKILFHKNKEIKRMLSKKMTFSLMSLITLLAFAFVAPFATAGVLGDKFATTITLNGAVGDNVAASGAITLGVVFGKAVADGVDTLDNPVADVDKTKDFDVADVAIVAFNKLTGAPVTVAVERTNGILPAFADSMTEYTVDLGTITVDTSTNTGGVVVLVTIAEGAVTNNNPADVVNAGTSDNTLGGNAKATLQFDVVEVVALTDPRVLPIEDLPGAVIAPGNPDSFTFTVTLSEKPAAFTKAHISVDATRATVASDPIALAAKVDAASSSEVVGSDRVYPYLVTITPKYATKDDIVIKINSFDDTATPTANKSLVSRAYVVKVLSDANRKVGLFGTEVVLPNKVVVPADGYLVVARDKGKSQITDPGNAEHGAAKIALRVSAKTQTYNMIALSVGVDLEGFLIRGGTIDLIAPAAGLAISEVMWATDGGSPDRQWIEIANTSGAEITIGDKTHKLMLYGASETVPDMTDATLNIQDRVSTLYRGANHWLIAGKGQSGRTDEIVKEVIADTAVEIEVVATDRLISMQRAVDAAGAYADGTMASSWSQSVPPSQNFVDAAGGLFVGSPGTSPLTPVEIVPVEPEPDPVVVPVAMPEDIMITEIMVDSGWR